MPLKYHQGTFPVSYTHLPLLLVVPFGLFVRPLEVLEVPGALDPGVCSGEVVSPPEGAAASLLALKEPGFEPDELGSSIGSGLPLQPVSPPVSLSLIHLYDRSGFEQAVGGQKAAGRRAVWDRKLCVYHEPGVGLSAG